MSNPNETLLLAEIEAKIAETSARLHRLRQIERWRVLQTLHRYQRYRIGKASYEECPSPKEISTAINYCIRELRIHFRPHFEDENL